MQFKRSFKMAISSLLSSKMRSILTMLGIIIGVSSVIIIVSLVNGFKIALTSTFESMGTNVITSTIMHPLYAQKVTDDDVFMFALENGDLITGVSPTVSISNATLKEADLSTTTSGIGVSEDYFDVNDLNLSEGQKITYLNCENYDKVVIIGQYNKSEFFGYESAIGQHIKINGEQFEVIGVLEQTSTAEEGTADDVFYIPYNTASRISRMAILMTYVFSSESSDNVLEVQALVDEFFAEILEDPDQDYYKSTTLLDLIGQVESLTDMITYLLGGIASISLLVGGIGIMNIMLVSVTERTREIGIRKSLGGKQRHILSQFIIESAVTSSIGGLLGIALGIIASFGIGIPLGIDVAISIPSIVLSFGVSLAIGVFFGYFPAKKASKLNPIDALRFD